MRHLNGQEKDVEVIQIPQENSFGKEKARREEEAAGQEKGQIGRRQEEKARRQIQEAAKKIGSRSQGQGRQVEKAQNGPQETGPKEADGTDAGPEEAHDAGPRSQADSRGDAYANPHTG